MIHALGNTGITAENLRKIENFKKSNAFWIEDYSLFMSIKDHLNGCSFLHWPTEIKKRKEDALKYYKELLKDDIDFYVFIQYLFYDCLSILFQLYLVC